MPIIQLEAQVSPRDLLRAVEQLSQPDLEQFVEDILLLRARRVAPCLPAEEAALLQRINESLPEPILQRYHELIAKRRAEALTPEEHAELLRLTDVEEKHNAQRVEALVKLAQLRQKPLRVLMDDLGIKAPACE
jgi:hypothetical protein